MKKLLPFLLVSCVLSALISCTDKSPITPIRQLVYRWGVLSTDSVLTEPIVSNCNPVIKVHTNEYDTTSLYLEVETPNTGTSDIHLSSGPDRFTFANGNGQQLQVADGGFYVTCTAASPGSAFSISPDISVIQPNVTEYTTPSMGGKGVLPLGKPYKAVFDFPNVPAGQTAKLSYTILGVYEGALVGDVVVLGIPNASKADGLIYGTPYVSATNVITVEAFNSTSAPINPGIGTFKLVVLRF